ncbi:glycoside hydrolase family 16 protein [Myceligenerans salitolerans]|uniref:Family 16 glycosylhydrolase n=1 Tax=Myceligenerans salitolerans TaxID=1230528 RepID=A0ABS3I8T6_9MICO|nr:glycoside hydrolase family 16 protein [Myceligenerans salitolerans]MBO0609430.1 family 16 glycosylhydrolase [Myceligenerans salitolerans]
MRATPRTRAVATIVTALSAVALAATGAVAAASTGTAASAADDADVAAAQLVWSDEFDGAAGSAPNPANWNHETGDHGWGNNELQNYTNSRDNSALDGNGNLVITARQEAGGGYTSARMTTKDKVEPQYGRVEARIQIPRGQGIWPAFWMLGAQFPDTPWPNSGEIDIMENVGYEPHIVHGTLHGPGYSGGGGVGGAYQHPQGWSFADDFHTFAIDWSPDRITWSVDGNAYMTRTPADVPGTWVYNQPFFMILNVAVGGNWPGYPDGTTQFPQQMRVDYVRVYDTEGGGDGGGQTGTVTTSNGMCLDVAWADTANGTPVQLAWCNGSAAQQWTFAADGSVRALGKCLDVAGGATAPGTRVQLWDCNGTGAQQWARDGGALRNPQSGLCLQPVGRAQNDGTHTEIAGCDGSTVQRWTTP